MLTLDHADKMILFFFLIGLSFFKGPIEADKLFVLFPTLPSLLVHNVPPQHIFRFIYSIQTHQSIRILLVVPNISFLTDNILVELTQHLLIFRYFFLHLQPQIPVPHDQLPSFICKQCLSFLADDLSDLLSKMSHPLSPEFRVLSWQVMVSQVWVDPPY